VTSAPRQAVDVGAVWLTLALPVLRLATGRATRLDGGLLALRLAMSFALAGAYERRGPAFWLSPLADPAAAVRLTASALRPARSWRGRTYAAAGRTAPRPAS
jgi:dolichol-phosphate mannosyltransferase